MTRVQGVCLEVWLLELFLVLEQVIVHSPEVRLCAHGLGSERGAARVDGYPRAESAGTQSGRLLGSSRCN